MCLGKNSNKVKNTTLLFSLSVNTIFVYSEKKKETLISIEDTKAKNWNVFVKKIVCTHFIEISSGVPNYIFAR